MDNQGAIALSENPTDHARTKHVGISYHWLRERIQERVFSPSWVPGTENIADICTKNLGRDVFNGLVGLMGLVPRSRGSVKI